MTQQERFEAWATSKGINITDNGFGGYDSQWTEGALAGWEAAQAQAAEHQPCPDGSSCKHGHWCTEVYCQGIPCFRDQYKAAVEPVAWMHDETGLIVRVSDIAKTSYNDLRIKSGEFSPLYASPPDYRNAMKAALEALNSCTPGDWSTGHVIDPYHDEKLVDAAIAALEEQLK